MDRSEVIGRIYDTAMEYDSPVKFLPPAEISFRHKFLEEDSLCCCMFDYYRNSMTDKMDMVGRIARNIIFQFKKGIIPDLCADLLTASIISEPLVCYNPDTVLLTIPASTRIKQEQRFKTFSRIFAENLGIVDGFSLIELERDRQLNDIRKGTSFSDVLNLTDKVSIIGKDILLMDDLYATGSSFKNMKELLMSAGAKSVTGVFLAKSLDNYKHPEGQ